MSKKGVNQIADFAVGDGALLAAAQQKWPNAQLVATDIDETRRAPLRRRLPDAKFIKCDFLTAVSRKKAIGKLKGQMFDLILLNPPFSNRAKQLHICSFKDSEFRSSKALAFISEALRYLKPNGELVAIVPRSVLVSERDEILLSMIRSHMTFDILNHQSGAFCGLSVKTSIIKIRNCRPPQKYEESGAIQMKQNLAVELVRGSVPVNGTKSDDSDPAPFIHTTNLVDHRVVDPHMRKSRGRVIFGDVVLLPRVGKPKHDKLAIHKCDVSTVISDCVFAMKTVPGGDEARLFTLLCSVWCDLEQLYDGSCAPYTTLSRLSSFLMGLGIETTIVKEFTLTASVENDPEISNQIFGDRAKLH